MKTMFEGHLGLVGKVMDMQLQRQNVVMSNIANVKTPRYRPLELEFEKELQFAVNADTKNKVTRTDPKHMPTRFDANVFGPSWDREFKPRNIYGEDRVNLDKEMAKMAKVNLQYSALSTVITKGSEGLNNIIQEGSK